MSLFDFLLGLGYTEQEAKETILSYLFGLDLTRKQTVDIQTFIS